MTAHSEVFPWPSYYGHYKYFESQVAKHGKVVALQSLGKGIYELTRTKGDTLRVFVCECYAFGVAEYMETVERIGDLHVVIINSAWCGYSPDAKKHCRDGHVGLFKIGELMAALHLDDYWRYLTESEQEFFKKQQWL